MLNDLYIGDIKKFIQIKGVGTGLSSCFHLIKKDALLVKIDGNGYVELEDFENKRLKSISEIPFYNGCMFVDGVKKYDTSSFQQDGIVLAK